MASTERRAGGVSSAPGGDVAVSRRVRAMKRRLDSVGRSSVPGALRFNPEDLATVSSELAWMTRRADPKLRSLSARLVMAVFDDDQIHRETGDYAVSPGLPGPTTGGWRAVEDFVALSASRNPTDALETLIGLVNDGYLEQLEGSGLFRPAQS